LSPYHLGACSYFFLDRNRSWWCLETNWCDCLRLHSPKYYLSFYHFTITLPLLFAWRLRYLYTYHQLTSATPALNLRFASFGAVHGCCVRRFPLNSPELFQIIAGLVNLVLEFLYPPSTCHPPSRTLFAVARIIIIVGFFNLD